MANDIVDPAKTRAIPLNAAGPATYRLVNTLAIPGKPTDLSFDEIVEKVKMHFNLKSSPISNSTRGNNSRPKLSSST